MCTVPGIAESTYKMCYRGEIPRMPFIRYKTLPCMYPAESKMSYRQGEQSEFGRKRVAQHIPHPPALPAPAKPRPVSGVKLPCTSRSLQNIVTDTKFGPMDMETMEKLYNKYRYTTFAQKAAAECDLQLEKPEPPTSLDPKADMVRLYAKRYEASTEEWQDAVLWDRLQSRYPTNQHRSPRKKKLLNNRQNGLDERRLNIIRNLVRTDGLANVFVRKCPGYAGYNSLCPPETKLNDKKNPPEWSTIMSASYGKFPDHVYDKQSFARQGPFSQTVTLTYPFNPFNKVGEDITTEKAGLYSTNGYFFGLIG
ncbi:uncharacterized protein LOC123550322 [Mercenaria mercenaria]|uniref:uncharacterized protein LOC123550322 n=1 Tax=Mercenaria mercenaria TaxID=6596 RepID=UPI00234F226B|nr:uncharacterized protein LOC123550322 [Mercenaria mercenaria]